MKISYAYDAAGNRTKKTVGGVETSYVYDAANRLTSATTGGNTITYGYDHRGNLTSQTEGSDVTSYEWDSRNRLTQVTLPDASSESYAYDAQDRRISKVNAAGTTKYVWDQENLLQERDGAGAVQAHYTDSPGTWGGLTSQRRGSTSHFYGYDLQGSTRFLTDASGAVTDSYAYSVYGEELSPTGSTVNPFRYEGQWGYYRDHAQRLYVRARHYRPSHGRWMSRDPMGFKGGDWNLYRYVSNDPVNEIDPMGMACLAKNITSSLTVELCSARKRRTLLGIVCLCEYSLEGLWELQFDIGKGGRKKDCSVYQWLKTYDVHFWQKPQWQRDTKEGFPYRLDRGVGGPNRYRQVDRPGISGPNYCSQGNDSYKTDFITCVEGTEGVIACFSWGLRFTLKNCVPTCNLIPVKRIAKPHNLP